MTYEERRPRPRTSETQIRSFRDSVRASQAPCARGEEERDAAEEERRPERFMPGACEGVGRTLRQQA